MFKFRAWRIYFFLRHTREYGLLSSFLLFWKLYTSMIKIRKNTSDWDAFREVFLKKAYDLGFLNLHPSTIIDGGANVGYASIFFAITYPQARIFAVEPEESNFEMLLRNTRFYRNIIPIRAALWHREEELQILDATAEKWAFQTVRPNKEKISEKVDVLTVDRLIDLGKIDTIDIFKIDIEGAEKELFSANYEKWLEKTNVIIIEVHDWFREGCGDELNNATKSFKFSREERKGHVILFKTVKNS
jgi:FkbM family methyltransferase